MYKKVWPGCPWVIINGVINPHHNHHPSASPASNLIRSRISITSDINAKAASVIKKAHITSPSLSLSLSPCMSCLVIYRSISVCICLCACLSIIIICVCMCVVCIFQSLSASVSVYLSVSLCVAISLSHFLSLPLRDVISVFQGRTKFPKLTIVPLVPWQGAPAASSCIFCMKIPPNDRIGPEGPKYGHQKIWRRKWEYILGLND